MASIADTIMTDINTNWGAGGGTKPTLYNTEDTNWNPPPGQDFIHIIGDRQGARLTPLSQGYDTSKESVFLICNSPTNVARLDIIVTEVKRLILALAPATYDICNLVRRTKTEQSTKISAYSSLMEFEIITMALSRT